MSIWSFKNEGKTLCINTADTPAPWRNRLFNSEYILDLTQRMQGPGTVISPVFKTVEHIAEKRDFFVKFNGEDYRLLCGLGKEYRCEQRPESSEVFESFNGFSVSVRAFVPAKGKAEIWTVKVRNESECEARISLFSCFNLNKAGTMGQVAKWDQNTKTAYREGFPYYVYYDEYESALKKRNICFVTSDTAPAAYETNTQRFLGTDNPFSIPLSVRNGKLACGVSDYGPACGALQFDFKLNSGEEKEINILAGVAKDISEVKALQDEYLNVSKQLSEIKKIWDERISAFTVDTPDDNLNALVNIWLKKQAVFLGKMNRASTYCPVRNQLQDAMGYAMIDADDAFEIACSVMKNQYSSGYLKGWVMTDGSAPQKLCLIEHSDGAIWLILCFTNIIEISGRKEYYERIIPYADGTEATVLEHLKQAARYMGNKVGEHGMCLMLDGDWTDPLNGPGRKGKGESTWNTAALIYAVRKLISVFPDNELKGIADSLEKSMNDFAWDGDWFYAGINDDGIPYGSHNDDEAKQFLNAQSFAVMAGAVKGERLEKVINSMEQLKIDTGYLLFAPAFEKYNPVWGRISAKNPGTAENGCAYCHGTMFKAGADAAVGNADRAFKTLYSVLPINPENPVEKNCQSPAFIPNFYLSLDNENFGLSSQNYGTGSVAWFLHIFVEKILGIQHTTNGVKVEPMLPSEWSNIKATRRYKGQIKEYLLNNK